MKLRVIASCLIASTATHGCRADAPETSSAPAQVEPSAPAPPSSVPPADSERYPVRWWRGLDLRALSEAEARLDAREPADFGALKLDDARARPASCREWLELHAKGYRPADSLDEPADREAKIRCQTLALMRDAKPAHTSHLRDLVWDHSLLRVLPAAVATVYDPNRERAIRAAGDAGKTLRELDPRVRAKPLAGDASVVILEGGRRMMISLHGEAWGDFNRDGVDDLVMSVVNGATHGEFSYARLMTVTRKTSEEMLVPIDVR